MEKAQRSNWLPRRGGSAFLPRKFRVGKFLSPQHFGLEGPRGHPGGKIKNKRTRLCRVLLFWRCRSFQMDVTKSAPKTKPHSSRVVVVWKGGAMKRTRQKPARRLVFVAEAPCAPVWWTIQDSNLKKNVLGSPCFCQIAVFAMDSWGCHGYPVPSKITPSYAFKGKNKGKCLAAQMH